MQVLRVENLSVDFEVATDGKWPWKPKHRLRAVNDISLELESQETLGLVGESGCGKTTLARAVVGTTPISKGSIFWNGRNLATMNAGARRQVRRDMSMIFQDPLSALNPRMTVGRIIAEPLRIHCPQLEKAEVESKVGALMERVGLLPQQANRYPHEFSGGQCQRISIARALVLNPKLVICDEPVAALDVSVRAQVVNLLQELQREFGLSMIFIAHDLSVVKHVSTRIMVMYMGKVVELAPAGELIANPRHPYTRALIASVPIPDPIEERSRPSAVLKGDLPSLLDRHQGCVFWSRCPEARAACQTTVPDFERFSEQHYVACPYQMCESWSG